MRGAILRCGRVTRAGLKNDLCKDPERSDDERSGTNHLADECRSSGGSTARGWARSGCEISVGFLVSGGAERGNSRAEARDGDAARSAVGAGADERGESVCDAGFVPAQGDSAFVRPTRRASARMLLPRMEVRSMQRTMRGDSVADEPGQAESGAHLCGTLSVRRTRRLRLGVHEWVGAPAAGSDSGGASTCCFQRKIQNYPSFVRASIACGPGNHRVDGSGAWAICASIVVLAEAREHS